MSEEEIDVLYNEILNLPKVERPITATTQCEINVNDLFDTIRAFRKIPDYNELIKDNRKKGKEIERLHSIIKEVREYIKEHQCCDGKINVMTKTEFERLLEILDKENI